MSEKTWERYGNRTAWVENVGLSPVMGQIPECQPGCSCVAQDKIDTVIQQVTFHCT